VKSDSQPRFTFAQRVVLAVVPRLVWALLQVYGRTWRYEVITEEGAAHYLYGQKVGPVIACFWHQCILPGSYYFRFSRSVLLISQSYDGELITRTARLLGYDAVRGSSSRGGGEGLLGLAKSIQNGDGAIFTADGPRGPIHQTKMGPIKLAQKTGAPILTFHLEPEKAWVLRSWDQFRVPKPFTRICVSWAHQMHVPAELQPEEFEGKRAELNAALERARLRALAYFGKPQS